VLLGAVLLQFQEYFVDVGQRQVHRRRHVIMAQYPPERSICCNCYPHTIMQSSNYWGKQGLMREGYDLHAVVCCLCGCCLWFSFTGQMTTFRPRFPFQGSIAPFMVRILSIAPQKGKTIARLPLPNIKENERKVCGCGRIVSTFFNPSLLFSSHSE
jgi:hypothetical protein